MISKKAPPIEETFKIQNINDIFMIMNSYPTLTSLIDLIFYQIHFYQRSGCDLIHKF